MHIMHTEINIEVLSLRPIGMRRPNSQPPIGRIKNRRQDARCLQKRVVVLPQRVQHEYGKRAERVDVEIKSFH